ncbi:MAG: methyl-accepting chemotaxis protein [Planctomycetota bacterium]
MSSAKRRRLLPNLNMSVSARLWSGFMLVAVLVGTGTVFGVTTARKSLNAMNDVADAGRDLALAGRLNNALLMARMNVKDFLIRNSDEDLRSFEQWAESFDESLAASNRGFNDNETSALLAECRSRWSEYKTKFSRVEVLVTERNTIRSTTLDPAGDRINSELRRLSTEAISAGDLQIERSVSSVYADFTLARVAAMKFLGRFDLAQHSYAMDAIAMADQSLARAIESAASESAREVMESIRGEIAVYHASMEQLGSLVADRNTLVVESLDVIGPQIAGRLGKIVERLEREQAEERSSAAEMVSAASMASLLAGGLGFGLSVLLAWRITLTLVRPIRRLCERLTDISAGQGDLTQRIDIRGHDELGQVGLAFNAFADKIQAVLLEVRTATGEVARASAEIASTSEQMSNGVTSQAQDSQTMVVAVGELESAVSDVARAATVVSDASSNAEKLASEGGGIVNQTVAEMMAIAEEVQESSEAVTALGTRSEEIGAIIDVINDIADQTNLLALNAAIEAARAGEHGRGFAVVADEVRKLAERTTQATEQVSDSIKEIQLGTRGAVERISTSSERANMGVVLTQRSGESLTEILEATRDVQRQTRDIAAAAEQQAATGAQISDGISRIEAVSGEASVSSVQAASAARGLSERAEHLERLVGGFKLADTRDPSSADGAYAAEELS